MKCLTGLILMIFCSVAEGGDYYPVDFAFGENNGWAVMYETPNNKRVIKYSKMLPKVLEKLDEVAAEGNAYKGIGLDGRRGWVITSENRKKIRVEARNIYPEVHAKIKELSAEGWLIKDVALTHSKGYVIIYGQSNYGKNGWITSGDIPKGLSDFLKDLKKGKGSLIGVGITPSGGWAAVHKCTDCGKWHWRYHNIPKEAVDFIKEKF